MTTDKRGVSALLLQRQLGLRRYETAWMMLHKLRQATVNLVREPLRGEVEVGGTWMGGPQAGMLGSRQLRVRKSAPVVAVVEKHGRATGRARMAVFPDFRGGTLITFLRLHVVSGSVVYTDGLSRVLPNWRKLGFGMCPAVNPRQPARSPLRPGQTAPWAT